MPALRSSPPKPINQMSTSPQFRPSTIAVSVELAENIIELLQEYRHTLKKKTTKISRELDILEDQEALARSHDEIAAIRVYSEKMADKHENMKDMQNQIKGIVKLLATTKIENKPSK